MQQVKVDVRGLQLGQLFLQDPVEIGDVLAHPGWGFGDQVEAVAGLGGDPLTDDFFAFIVVIRIGGINIVYAVLVGVIEHFHRFRTVDFTIFVNGETHTAEAQQGSPCRDFPFFSGFHNNPLSMIHNGVRCSIHYLI